MTVCLPMQFGERNILSPDEMHAVESLVDTCTLADGFNPCLNFDTNLNADRNLPAWRLIWAEPAAGTRTCGDPLPRGKAAKTCGILAGVASIFAPNRAEAEISACVAPVFRRKGIFTALFDSLAGSLVTSGVESVLLVSEGASPLGIAISANVGASLDHSEYRMTFPGQGALKEKPPGDVRLLPVGIETVEEMVGISVDCFSEHEADARSFIHNALADAKREMFLARDSSGVFGTVSITREDGGWMVHGLGVLPSMRSRGLGGKLLDSIVRVLLMRESGEIRLEVDSENGAARALYLSRGFIDSGRVDYWKVPMAIIRSK